MSKPVNCLCGVINPMTEQVYSFCPFHCPKPVEPIPVSPSGPAPSVVERRPQAMKIKVVRCDGSQEVLTLTGPITMMAGEHQNRLVTSTGMEHWFTLEGVYDGWGMACNFEIPAEAMPADGLPPDVRSFIDAINSEREILPKDGE